MRMNTTLKNKPQKNLLYLLELAPISEHILEKISVQEKVEQIFLMLAQSLDFEIDSCDILCDFVAITMYVKPSINIENLVIDLKKQSTTLLINEFKEFKQFVVDDSLWNADDELDLL